MLARRCMFLVGVAVILVGCGPKDKSADSRAAGAAATEWLAWVDEAAYARSWDEGAYHFRATVSKKAWQGLLEKMRTPLGAVLERRASATPNRQTDLAGAPAGVYFILSYVTDFEQKKAVKEQVTVVFGRDETWSVAAYYLD